MPGLGHRVDQLLAVERVREGLAHFRIVEGRFGRVEAIVVGGQARRRIVLRGQNRVGLDAVQVVQRDVLHIELAVFIHGKGSRILGHHDGIDARDLHLVRVKVVRVLDENHLVIMLPRVEHVGAVGHNVLRLGPLVTVRLDGIPGYGTVDPHAGDGGKITRRLLERELDGEIVDCPDADSVEIRVLARVHGLGVLDDIVDVGIVGGRLWVDRPLHGVFDVVGRDLFQLLDLLVVQVVADPVHVLAHRERPDQAVAGDAPLARQLGDHLHRVVVKVGQSQEQSRCDLDGHTVRRQGRVARGWLGL